MYLEDTIAAIATPVGTGGIGIIRVSGPRAEEVAHTLFKSSKKLDRFASHRLYHGDIVAPSSGAVLDEVLLTVMNKPSSYTGEDVVEIHCHGGYLILQAVLNEVLKTGCRPAMPGEFTKRAFLNNRIDLSQAEAVSDMITAKTEKGRELALSHLKGHLSEIIHHLRYRLVSALALLEASLDFPEDEVSQNGASDRSVEDIFSEVIHELQEIIATYDRGACLRNGVNVVIAGRPNVGKSSLLNALTGQKRAIVTPIPGTTRDFIEEFIDIGGLPVKLTDTAGVRPPEDMIEKEGLELVQQKLLSADLILVLLDGSESLTEVDCKIMADNAQRKVLLVVNKDDLQQRLDCEELETILPDHPILRISAKLAHGLSELKGAIREAVMGGEENLSSRIVIANARHKYALEKTVDSLARTKEAYLKDLPAELVTIDLRDALSSLGEITGPTTDEEVLKEIFSNFCIGK